MESFFFFMYSENIIVIYYVHETGAQPPSTQRGG